MNRANEGAKDTLVKLAAGEIWNLSQAERLAVSLWATMFTMTHEFADAETVATTPEERHYIMTWAQPPNNWYIMIAPYVGGKWEFICNHRALAISKDGIYPEQANAQSTVFTFGKCAIHTLSGVSPAIDVRSYATALGLTLIWPPPGDRIDASPTPIDDMALTHLAFHALGSWQ